MSESEGLTKLTEYLKQTRRQAEVAIDNLNGQLSILKDENSQLNEVIHNLQQERDHYRSQLEQIQQNPSKWKFKERDEWKALVDSIQADRSRLQEENAGLMAAMEDAKNEIAFLKNNIELLNEDRLHLQSQLNEQSPLSATTTALNHGSSDQTGTQESPRSPNNHLLLSPMMDRNGREMSFFGDSPRSIARQLKHELKKAYEQIEEERKVSDYEKKSQRAEIVKLKGKLMNHNQEPSKEMLGTEIALLNKDQTKETPTSWIGSWLGIIFSGSNASKDSHSPTILQV